MNGGETIINRINADGDAAVAAIKAEADKANAAVLAEAEQEDFGRKRLSHDEIESILSNKKAAGLSEQS